MSHPSSKETRGNGIARTVALYGAVFTLACNGSDGTGSPNAGGNSTATNATGGNTTTATGGTSNSTVTTASGGRSIAITTASGTTIVNSGSGGTNGSSNPSMTTPTGGVEAIGGTKATGGTSTAGGTKAIAGTSTAGGSTGTGGTKATFRNPLNTAYGSDPFMLYYNGYYYLAATTWGTTLTMKRGATVQALKNASTTVIWSDSNTARSGNMWAPELYLLDNGAGQLRWYHYYTAGDGSDLGTQRPYVLESDGTDPMGPYHFKAQLLNYWAIDGSLLKVGSQLYFMFSAWDASYQKLWLIAMSNPWTVTGTRTQLSMSTYDWEKEGTATPVTNNYVNEGPNALYHGGRTFVTYSASQCGSPGYKLGMLELVASNPLATASWTKSATAVFQTANNAYGSGHNGFFKSPDGTEDWLVYHATTNAAGSCWTDRTTRIQRISWNANGTPNFGVPLALSTDITVPSGE